MSVDAARARQQHLRDMAAGDGLDMRFDLTRGGNTFDVTACSSSPPSTGCRAR